MAKYASQPQMPFQPMQPGMGGMGNLNSHSGIFPWTQGTNLASAQKAGQRRPNPAAHPKVPLGAPATAGGIAQVAQQKLAFAEAPEMGLSALYARTLAPASRVEFGIRSKLASSLSNRWLFDGAGDDLSVSSWVKDASTALVRQIGKGLLSPGSITRAAGAMAPGKFRTVSNLGRGQFTLADQVVGNVGKRPGVMVRKLPTTVVPSPVSEYNPISKLTNHWNNRYTETRQQAQQRKLTGAPAPAPPIAPFNAVNSKGGFQQMATGHVPEIHPDLKRQLGDQHGGNVGPNGQVIDFSVRGNASTPHNMELPTSIEDGLLRQRIDAATVKQKDGYNWDRLGNQDETVPYANKSNDIVRKYWALKPHQRPAYLAQLEQGVPARRKELNTQVEQLTQKAFAKHFPAVPAPVAPVQAKVQLPYSAQQAARRVRRAEQKAVFAARQAAPAQLASTGMYNVQQALQRAGGLPVKPQSWDDTAMGWASDWHSKLGPAPSRPAAPFLGKQGSTGLLKTAISSRLVTRALGAAATQGPERFKQFLPAVRKWIPGASRRNHSEAVKYKESLPALTPMSYRGTTPVAVDKAYRATPIAGKTYDPPQISFGMGHQNLFAASRERANSLARQQGTPQKPSWVVDTKNSHYSSPQLVRSLAPPGTDFTGHPKYQNGLVSGQLPNMPVLFHELGHSMRPRAGRMFGAPDSYHGHAVLAEENAAWKRGLDVYHNFLQSLPEAKRALHPTPMQYLQARKGPLESYRLNVLHKSLPTLRSGLNNTPLVPTARFPDPVPPHQLPRPLKKIYDTVSPPEYQVPKTAFDLGFLKTAISSRLVTRAPSRPTASFLGKQGSAQVPVFSPLAYLTQLPTLGGVVKAAAMPNPMITPTAGPPVTAGSQGMPPGTAAAPMGQPQQAAAGGPPAAPPGMPGQGQPPMPGMAPQGMAPQGGQPNGLVPPMGEPIQQPLPMNPPMSPPRQMTPGDQHQQSTINSLLDAGNSSLGEGQEDIQHDLMGIGAKMGSDSEKVAGLRDWRRAFSMFVKKPVGGSAASRAAAGDAFGAAPFTRPGMRGGYDGDANAGWAKNRRSARHETMHGLIDQAKQQGGPTTELGWLGRASVATGRPDAGYLARTVNPILEEMAAHGAESRGVLGQAGRAAGFLFNPIQAMNYHKQMGHFGTKLSAPLHAGIAGGAYAGAAGGMMSLGQSARAKLDAPSQTAAVPKTTFGQPKPQVSPPDMWLGPAGFGPPNAGHPPAAPVRPRSSPPDMWLGGKTAQDKQAGFDLLQTLFNKQAAEQPKESANSVWGVVSRGHGQNDDYAEMLAPRDRVQPIFGSGYKRKPGDTYSVSLRELAGLDERTPISAMDQWGRRFWSGTGPTDRQDNHGRSIRNNFAGSSAAGSVRDSGGPSVKALSEAYEQGPLDLRTGKPMDPSEMLQRLNAVPTSGLERTHHIAVPGRGVEGFVGELSTGKTRILPAQPKHPALLRALHSGNLLNSPLKKLLMRPMLKHPKGILAGLLGAAGLATIAKDPFNSQTKQAAPEIDETSGLSNGIANSIGHVGGMTLGMKPLISGDMMSAPDMDSTRDIVKRMGKHAPELANTRVEVGGSQPLTRISRVWNNPNLSIFGKLQGTVASPVGAIMSNFTRGDHYDPLSDTVGLYSKPSSILQHELGHAIDFNSGQQGVARDAYSAAYAMSPIGKLWHEGKANTRSRDVLGKAYGQKQLNDMDRERWHTLTPAYGTYVGGAAAGVHQTKTMLDALKKSGIKPSLGGRVAASVAPDTYLKMIAKSTSGNQHLVDAVKKIKGFRLPAILAGLAGGHLVGRAVGSTIPEGNMKTSMDKSAEFNHKDLDLLGKLGVTRQANGKIKSSNNSGTTEKVKHTQRVRDPAIKSDWSPSQVRTKASADMTPFAFGFFSRCEALGYTVEMTKQAVDSIGDKYGEAAQQELQSGLLKQAFLGTLGQGAKWGAKLPAAGAWIKNFFTGAKATAKAAPAAAKAAPKGFQGMTGTMGRAAGGGVPKVTTAPGLDVPGHGLGVPFWAQTGRSAKGGAQLGGLLGGGYGGYTGYNDPEGGGVSGALGGAFKGGLVGAGAGSLFGAGLMNPGITRGLASWGGKNPTGVQSLVRGANRFAHGYAKPLTSVYDGVMKGVRTRSIGEGFRGVGQSLKNTWNRGGLAQAGLAIGGGQTAYELAGAGKNYLKGQMTDAINQGVSTGAADAAGALSPWMQEQMDQYLANKGMLNDQGQMDPSGMIGRGISGGADKLISMFGGDPSQMGGIQKALSIGGPLAGLYGLASGNNTIAGLGGLAALGGIGPEVARQYGAQAPEWMKAHGLAGGGSSGLLGSEHGRRPGDPPWSPTFDQIQARNGERPNEWQLQRGGQGPTDDPSDYYADMFDR